ncbi:DUF2599 domain-containing protein [Cellulomonas endophytica]|uniref:DUF2599 domain-containing protein n=1 Tax=Cellulomonas endophytica TaxID=2494735 RepID=UPI001010E6CA|nr:DUF2599 domain-containing protein [Cellulomonas endophytica]
MSRLDGGRRGRTLLAAVLAAGVAGGVLAGCTPGGGTPPPSAAATAPGTGADPQAGGPDAPAPGLPDAATVRGTGTPLVVGTTTLWVLPTAGAGVRTLAAEDGSAVAVVTVPTPATGAVTGAAGGAVGAGAVGTGAAGTGGVGMAAPAAGDRVVVAVLAAPADRTLAVRDDGSVVVDAGDAFVAGLAPAGHAPPSVALTPAGSPRVAAVDPAAPAADASGADDAPTGPGVVVTLTVPAGAVGDVPLWLADVTVLDATWGQREGGRSLAVEPSAWARAGGQAAGVGVWAQVVAREPEADLPTMRDQLWCHQLGAPEKDTWNLEPWRPEVDTLTLLAAGCNPVDGDG